MTKKITIVVKAGSPAHNYARYLRQELKTRGVPEKLPKLAMTRLLNIAVATTNIEDNLGFMPPTIWKTIQGAFKDLVHALKQPGDLDLPPLPLSLRMGAAAFVSQTILSPKKQSRLKNNPLILSKAPGSSPAP